VSFEIEDLKTKGEDSEGNSVDWVGVDEKTVSLLSTNNIYAVRSWVKDGQSVARSDLNGIHIMELSFLSLLVKLLTKI
jgi:hypothetical protein